MSALSLSRNSVFTAWVVFALGFSIPFSTAIANVFLLLFLIAWMLMPERRQRLLFFWENPLARGALILFLALALGCLWGEAPFKERVDILKKYADLLLIGFMAGAIFSEMQRLRALQGFGLGMLLLLLLSTAIWIGLLPEGFFGKAGSGAVVMKLSITHSWLMACFAFAAALWAVYAKSPVWRWLFGLAAGLAVLNIFLMVGGRTGYVVLAVLAAYGFFAWKGWRGLVLAVIFLSALGALTFSVSPRFSGRVNEAVSEVRNWQSGVGARSSQGLRLDWYRTSLQLIADRPIFGHGTGSFAIAAKKQQAGSNIVASENPHNEYLLLAVQLGLAGPLLFLALLWFCWRSALKLAPRDRHLLRGIVVAMATGCLFNSFLLDFTEGLFFAWMVGVLGSALKTDEKNATLASRV